MPDFIFNGWGAILRMLAIAPAAYVAVVLIWRVSGKRTLSKLNAFDFIVTISIGSPLASVITTQSLALAEGIVALAIVVSLQFVVTAASVRWPSLGRALKADPTLLLCNGEPLSSAMKRQRITLQELDVAVRQAGGTSQLQAQAIYLEADGTLTALMRSDWWSGSTRSSAPKAGAINWWQMSLRAALIFVLGVLIVRFAATLAFGKWSALDIIFCRGRRVQSRSGNDWKRPVYRDADRHARPRGSAWCARARVARWSWLGHLTKGGAVVLVEDGVADAKRMQRAEIGRAHV